MMTIDTVKAQICRAGHQLKENGLVARSWGNVSCRIDKNYFAVTPSGITYEQLKPEHIPVVNIRDLTFDGTFKPSTETGIHAGIYEKRPEIHAVIHTHQAAASSVSAARQKTMVLTDKEKQILGKKIRTAPYALPGTRKLKKAAVEGLLENKAVLLANHGAICIGTDMEDAFHVATTLEKACQKVLLAAFAARFNIQNPDHSMLHKVWLDHHKERHP
jgi:L-fuculose-phosphate aldolase